MYEPSHGEQVSISATLVTRYFKLCL